MAKLEMGIRIDMQKGIAFFGVEEVNQRIAAGGKLVEVRPGGAIMSKVEETAENTHLTLSGCQFEVVFEDA